MTDNILKELQWRGLVYDATEGIEELLNGKNKITLYNGFDPTGSSLHVGNLVPMVQLARFQRFGHTPIAIAGGGTGMVGDPSGKSEERNLLTPAEIEANLEAIRPQLAGILDFEAKGNPARIINNADWLARVPMMEFLRDVGKHFSVNYMMAKESVRSRLEREEGISYTEFSYMLLQAYDFLTLYRQENCQLQTGGSDQWGNIVAGTELIRKKLAGKAHGLVYPLITGSGGTKFGKTAGGDTVWLDPGLTSPYRFYQWLLNTEDGLVIDYLKYFTFLDRATIARLAEQVVTAPEGREAQRRLAEEVTGMVHGPTALQKARVASDVLFGGELTGLDAGDIADIFADVPSSDLPKAELEGEGALVIDLVANSTLAPSRGQAKRDIKGGGIYLNNVRVEELGRMVTLADTVDGQFLVLRKGKKRYHLVRIRN